LGYIEERNRFNSNAVDVMLQTYDDTQPDAPTRDEKQENSI